MAHLVGDDVSLGELGLRAAELLFQLVEERGVEVDRLVGGAVERPEADGALPQPVCTSSVNSTMCGGS
jgi:hypothetical protein